MYLMGVRLLDYWREDAVRSYNAYLPLKEPLRQFFYEKSLVLLSERP